MTRKETDSLGSVEVPDNAYYGAQTQRSRHFFAIGDEKMPLSLIHALVLVKKACALVNGAEGLVPKEKVKLIVEVCDEILAGKFDDQFILSVWQTGSGTQTNMNVNEVISNRAIEKVKGVRGSKEPIHPNDDVNRSQSTNDVYPTAMHVATALLLRDKLLPELKRLHVAFQAKAKEFQKMVKVGRTHLMDAVPITLGQEFSGYAAQLAGALSAIETSSKSLSELAVGGTAVGTGLNAPPKFGEKVSKELSQMTGISFVSAKNKFAALAAHDELLDVSGALKRLASALFKIANDIRWLASGPRCGLGEINLPANEPGSSFMPGKVNPTQCEAMVMIAVQVMGNDSAIGVANALGNLEINAMKPMIAYNLIQSIRILSDGMKCFNDFCVVGITANEERLEEFSKRSLMLVTALAPAIGYDKAAQVAKKAFADDTTLKEAALALGLLSAKELDALLDPSKMTGQ